MSRELRDWCDREAELKRNNSNGDVIIEETRHIADEAHVFLQLGAEQKIVYHTIGFNTVISYAIERAVNRALERERLKT